MSESKDTQAFVAIRAKAALSVQKDILKLLRKIKEVVRSPELNEAVEPMEEMLREHLRVFLRSSKGYTPLPGNPIAAEKPRSNDWVGPFLECFQAHVTPRRDVDYICTRIARIVLDHRKQRGYCREIYHALNNEKTKAHEFMSICMDHVALMELMKNLRGILMGIAPREDDKG